MAFFRLFIAASCGATTSADRWAYGGNDYDPAVSLLQVRAVASGTKNEQRFPETIMVDVPVVEVVEVPVTQRIPVVVDDEVGTKRRHTHEDDEDDVPSEGDDGEDRDDLDPSSSPCMQAFEELMHSEKHLAKARVCEEKTGHSADAIKALRDMDAKAALKSIEKTFHECGGMTKTCASELAPEELLHMRLTGVATEEKCAEIAASKNQASDAGDEACQMDMSQEIVAKLATGDLEKAMMEAEHGLRQCNSIKHPCDFQLAPLLVAQLIQHLEQEEMDTGMLLDPSRQFSTLVDSVMKPSYYIQTMLLQE